VSRSGNPTRGTTYQCLPPGGRRSGPPGVTPTSRARDRADRAAAGGRARPRRGRGGGRAPLGRRGRRTERVDERAHARAPDLAVIHPPLAESDCLCNNSARRNDGDRCYVRHADAPVMAATTITTTPPSLGLSEPELRAWRGLLRSTPRSPRRSSAEMEAAHGLSLSAYEVLMFLAAAPEHRMRMRDLADSVILSRSGLTRLVDRSRPMGCSAGGLPERRARRLREAHRGGRGQAARGPHHPPGRRPRALPRPALARGSVRAGRRVGARAALGARARARLRLTCGSSPGTSPAVSRAWTSRPRP
jgi:hypothetical protein